MTKTVWASISALMMLTASAGYAQDKSETDPSSMSDMKRLPGQPGDNPLQNAQPSRVTQSGPARAAPPSVLAILAHPDDEITIAPVLARIARSGGEVTLIYATSGDAGPGTSGLEDAGEIAGLREKEGRCAAFALGLKEPTFWNLGDGRLATMARAPDSAANRALDNIRAALAEAQPEVVMTWGPDGGYGHADHRMISALVTQVVGEMGPNRPDLLYAAFPQVEAGVLPGFESWATTAPELLTDRIRYGAEDLDATETALRCYESQFPAPARQALVRLLHGRVWQGQIHFRAAFSGER